jgi:hypothetical protein
MKNVGIETKGKDSLFPEERNKKKMKGKLTEDNGSNKHKNDRIKTNQKKEKIQIILLLKYMKMKRLFKIHTLKLIKKLNNHKIQNMIDYTFRNKNTEMETKKEID